MDPDLEALCIHEVAIRPKTGSDVNQKPTYGASVNWRARVEMGAKMFSDKEGKSVPAQGIVVLVPRDATTLPGIEDEMTLPAGFPIRVTPLMKVDPEFDEVGLYHIEAYF